MKKKKNYSSDPKFHDATFHPLLNPRLGTWASPALLPFPRNPGSGRLAGAGRRHCKQWRPGLPRPSAHTESQPGRRTPTSGRRLPGPGSSEPPEPARSSLPASDRIGPALGVLTAIPRAPVAPEDRGLGTHPAGQGEDAQHGPHGDAGAETHGSEQLPARWLTAG